MKKFLSVFLICVMAMLAAGAAVPVVSVCAADVGVSESVVIDNTKGVRTKTYTMDTALVPGDYVMLEYTYTAKRTDEMIYAEIAYPYLGETWRPVLFDADGKVSANRARITTADRFYTEIGAISEGETYHAIGVLQAGKDNTDSSGRIYLNGALVHSGYVPLNIGGGEFKTINVLPGVRAVFTKLTGMTALADFDYSGYLARLTSASPSVAVSSEACANFTVTLSGAYTVSSLKNALIAPAGAALSFMHNGRVLPEDAPVVEGTRILVQSANQSLALSYRVTGGAVPFETTYQTDHGAGLIWGIPALTTVADFKSAVMVTGDFSIDGVYRGEEPFESGYISSGMTLRLKNGSGFVEYTLSADGEPADGVIRSEEYPIDYSNKQITETLPYTPVESFLEKFSCVEGAEILGVYAGTEQITDKIEEDSLTLRVNNRGVTEEYRLQLADSGRRMRAIGSEYLLDGIDGTVMGSTVMIEGKVGRTEADKEKTIAFYDPYRAESGCVLSLSDNGNMYFWGHLLGKREPGREYAYRVYTDTETAEARVYIDGEKVLEHLYVPFFAGVTNPVYLVASFDPGADFIYSRVSAEGTAEPVEKVYNSNFKIVSEYFPVVDNTIYIADARYTVEQLLERLDVTHGATVKMCTADGRAAGGSARVSDGMYVLVGREDIQKRYDIYVQTEGIMAAGVAKLYKNEISGAQLVSDTGNIPVLAGEDRLIAVANISNYGNDSNEVAIYAAGYDENGRLLAVGAGQSEIPANTDGVPVSATLTAEQLTGAQSLRVYLWDGALRPLLNAEIRIQRDESRLDDYECRDEALNMITSALVHPNYKGLIYEENGENDIQLMLRVDEQSLPTGKRLADYRVEIMILDPEENVVVQSGEETITPQMNVTFSSKDLKLGDYVLKAALIEKESTAEVDYNIWPLRKRGGDISELSSYVDENGRFIKDGKPKFYIGVYGPYHAAPEHMDLYKDNGVDGLFLLRTAGAFQQGGYSEQWLTQLDEAGMDLFADMNLFKEVSDDRINFKLYSNADERRVLENRMDTLKNRSAVAGYYVGDERPPEASDKIRWHSDIISSLDLEKPTFYMDWRGGNHAVFLHNGSADIMGIDNYPVTLNQDDAAINAITRYTASMTENFINKPVWMALQCHNIGIWNSTVTVKAQTPTEKQQRNMAMQAVCGGATGIWWYGYHELVRETTLVPEEEPEIAARVDQNTDFDKMVARTMGVCRLFSRLGDIIMSDEEPPQVSIEGAGNGAVQSMVKRYNGKTYLFAVNTSIFDQGVSITVSGTKRVKNIYTGEHYEVDSQGSFTAVLENIGIGVFEIEQDDYLSHDSALKNISVINGEDSLVITYDANGDMVVNVPADSGEIVYTVEKNEKATLYVNGEKAGRTGVIAADSATFRVVAEDGSETAYRVTICRVN